jgi:hypothetical protein
VRKIHKYFSILKAQLYIIIIKGKKGCLLDNKNIKRCIFKWFAVTNIKIFPLDNNKTIEMSNYTLSIFIFRKIRRQKINIINI